MSFDETNSDDFGEAPLPEESNNNRTFMIAVGILGGIILISVACLGAVYVFSRQSRTTAQNRLKPHLRRLQLPLLLQCDR